VLCDKVQEEHVHVINQSAQEEADIKTAFPHLCPMTVLQHPSTTLSPLSQLVSIPVKGRVLWVGAKIRAQSSPDSTPHTHK